MSTPKTIRAAHRLLQQVSRTARTFTKGLIGWLLRGLLVMGRQPLFSKAGFVLPTTVLLLLVVTLTVGAISYRTFTRSQQTIGERQQKVIYNAATPAIDRAKAKIEFLFDPAREPRGGGVPSQRQLLGMMLNDNRDLGGGIRVPLFPGGGDAYTFEDERRVDINEDGLRDNAWRYRVDLDGNGTIEPPSATSRDGWAVYSITFAAPPSTNTTSGSTTTSINPLRDSTRTGLTTRATATPFPFVRNAPLSNATQNNPNCERNTAGSGAAAPLINADGWFPDPIRTTKLRKNFQIDAYVLPDNSSVPVATLELQQDREATQGFKWAAWFRNDLEIFPGSIFLWNGAMHTEGSYILGSGSNFRSFLISSPSSCLYTKDASLLTTAQVTADPTRNIPAYQGQVITGMIRENSMGGSPRIDIWSAPGVPPSATEVMGSGADSVRPESSPAPTTISAAKPADFALEPVKLQTEDVSVARMASSTGELLMANPTVARDSTWTTRPYYGTRFIEDPQSTAPYVDDTYRADNRHGPKPRYGRNRTPIPGRIGEPIQGSITELIGDDPPGSDPTEVGLDGYWERRARREGLRLIVGQRLELGDPAGWGGPIAGTDPAGSTTDPIVAAIRVVQREPLRPWRTCVGGSRCNEQRQRKTMWDNLAAVQATAVYHNALDTTTDTRDYPDACIATTVHPGTPGTLDRSSTFENLAYPLQGSNVISGYTDSSNPLVISDFFRGRGTNGWEFSVPPLADFKNPASNLRKAMSNLAYFAGDPSGGAPSFTPDQLSSSAGDRAVHPHPSMAMWGDFSMLRRVLDRMGNSSTAYDSLSPADKTVLHTAGCTLGMLAYNLDYLEKMSYPSGNSVLGINPPGLSHSNENSFFNNPNYSEGVRGFLRVLRILTSGDATRIAALQSGIAQPSRNLPPASAGIEQISSQTLNYMVGEQKSNDPETWLRLMERWRNALTTNRPSTVSAAQAQAKIDQLNESIAIMRLIITKEQVARDRQFGFWGQYNLFPIGSTSAYALGPLGKCNEWMQTDTATPGAEPLAVLCSKRPRYPILYSLFPAKLADESSPPAFSDNPNYSNFVSHKDIVDRTNEEGRVRDVEDSNSDGGTPLVQNYLSSVNPTTVNYVPVKPADIALQPLGLTVGNVTLGSSTPWTLPRGDEYALDPAAPSTGTTPNHPRYNLIKMCQSGVNVCSNTSTTGNLVRVPFKDSALFNGREAMSVRVLDVDLDLMRHSTYPRNSNEVLLPKSGLIYAFREDAVSETNIVRPNTADWQDCNSNAKLANNTSCRMDTGTTNAFRSTDPPLNSTNGISPKPVDYYPDPDRRPYGFRLRNGSTLVRVPRDADKDNGMSFITDNAAYVQGNFNLHRLSNGTLLEEFTTALVYPSGSNPGNFYDRTTLDTRFANFNEDQWRPTEVLADGVTLLSDNFCDGSIEDGILNIPDPTNGGGVVPAGVPNGVNFASFPSGRASRYGCSSSSNTSYLNQNRMNNAIWNDATSIKRVLWERTSIADSLPNALFTPTSGDYNAGEPNPTRGDSPIFMGRNGRPWHWTDDDGYDQEYDGTYERFSRLKRRITAPAASNPTRMNMIMVSGIVPSQPNQPYGGLHNFPRFIEDWGGRPLYFSGAFLQLSFSSASTGPFDQDAWEVGDSTDIGSGCPENDTDTENICYYQAPNRFWGYDVGLQYVKAGPVAQRFKSAERTRSEFYSEPAADDPYIQRLATCAADGACPAT